MRTCESLEKPYKILGVIPRWIRIVSKGRSYFMVPETGASLRWIFYGIYHLFLWFLCRFSQIRDRVSGFLVLMAVSGSITAFLALYEIFCAVSAQQCRNEYSIYGMMLERHTFKKTKASNWSACVQACNDDTRCQSMNYVIGQEICELNNRTREASPEDFVPRYQRSYLKRSIKRGIML